MNKEIKKGLVPVLRFPEFSEKLKNCVISDFAHVTTGNKDTQNKVDNGDYPFFVRSQTVERINSFSYDGEAILTSGDGVGVGKNFHYIVGKFDFHQRVYCIYNFDKTVSGKFIYQYFSENFYKRAIQLSAKNSVDSVRMSMITEMPISLPELPEQTKIAACLSSLDDLITAQTQKIEALKTHKKGLMQQLFPQEGETVPKLRFPEFEGDWKETTLGQVAKYENGKAHEQDIVELGKFIVVNSKFISTDGEVKKFTNTAFCLAEKEDILIVLSDIPNGRAIAKCFFVDLDNLYTVNQRICKITAIKAVSMMLFYLLNRNSYFLAFDDGVKQTNLKKDDVLNCPILLPKDSEEQQKIADCLSSLDELINAHVKKCELLKIHKKGLMQGLFPSSNE